MGVMIILAAAFIVVADLAFSRMQAK